MNVSVLMTTYNCATFISQAIKSVLFQTYKDFEFLIIDDGSTDNTEQIVKKFNDERIIFIQSEHIGRSAALNIGLKEAKYDLIALMDADDISHPLRFEKQIELVKNSNQFIFCDTAYFIEKKIKYIIKSPNNSFELKKKIALHGHFNNSSSLFNKNHVLINGGFDEKLKAYEDYDLWLRLKDKSEFIVLPEIYHFVRLRKNSMTTSNPGKLKHIIYTIQEPYFNDLSDSFGITNTIEQNNFKGWREFFYGNKNQTRFLWRKIEIADWDYRMIIAYILSFLPLKTLNYFKSRRIRLILKFILTRNKKYKGLDEELCNLLAEVSK